MTPQANTEKIRCCGYIRVSSPKQVRERDQENDRWEEKISLPFQSEQIEKFAVGNDYDLTKIYADEGISGGSVKKPSRPAAMP